MFKFRYCRYFIGSTLLVRETSRRNVHIVSRHAIIKMPKDMTKSTAELRHIRLKAKAASSQQPSSKFVLTVLGNGGHGNPRCLYVMTDNNRYIFNCGEGTQRLSSEHKLKVSKLEHIFFTRRSWENIGGLLGLSLTLQSIGVPNITLHGPAEIKDLFRMTSRFVVAKELMVFQKEPVDGGIFSDSCMNVRYVVLHSTRPPSSEHKEAELDALTTDTLKVFPPPPAKRPRLSNEDVAIAYICKVHNRPGELSMEKCVNLNVPPGPLLGQLKSGLDVTLPDGRVIKSSDVVSPERRGPIFIVMECPCEDFLDSLTQSIVFKDHQASSPEDNHPSVVVHFSPPEVIACQRYQDWMDRFPTSTLHLILNSDCSSLSSLAAYRLQTKLHVLHPKVFPNLNQPSPTRQVENSGMAIYADTMLSYSMWTAVGLDKSAVLSLKEEEYIQAVEENVDFMESLSNLKLQLPQSLSSTVVSSENHSLPGGEIVFLGTGSSIPSKDRNVSAILWNLTPGRSILLDCGEGTYSQLARLYGYQKALEILSRIKMIFLSHVHADHHMGLMQVLKMREVAFRERNEPYVPVDILAPIQFANWFQQYHKVFEPILHLFRLIPAQLLAHGNPTVPTGPYTEILQNLKLKELSTVYVRHCNNAFGIVLTTDDKWKLVYSGDTMPCKELVEAGMSCSLLIHEATMEDDLEREAVLKTHSTTSQAIEIGQEMKAKFTLLTHFSQRYAKVPLFNDNFHNAVGCAFDNMTITQEEMEVLPLLIPCLKHLFHEHYEGLEEKTHKLLMRQKILSEMKS